MSQEAPTTKHIVWPLVICSSILIVIVVNLLFLVTALSTPVTLVDERPYSSGLKYQKLLEDAAKLREAGIDLEVQLEDAGKTLVIRYVQDSNKEFGIEIVSAKLQPLFPSNSTVISTFEECGERSQCAPFPQEKGKWRIDIDVRVGRDVLRVRRTQILD